jgi:hypothetical protein
LERSVCKELTEIPQNVLYVMTCFTSRTIIFVIFIRMFVHTILLLLKITYLVAGGVVCNCRLGSGVEFVLCSGVRLDKLERFERTSETGATPRELNIWSNSFL